MHTKKREKALKNDSRRGVRRKNHAKGPQPGNRWSSNDRFDTAKVKKRGESEIPSPKKKTYRGKEEEGR